MNQFCVHITLEPWLAQWFVNENGGETPVVVPRLSVEHRIFDVFLTTLPAAAQPDRPGDNTVAVVVPVFKHRPVERYNYLPHKAKVEMRNCIRNRFIIQLWNDLHHFGHIGKRRDTLIYAWMEQNGIELTDTNWNAIAKIYQRQYYNYYYRKYYHERKDKKK